MRSSVIQAKAFHETTLLMILCACVCIMPGSICGELACNVCVLGWFYLSIRLCNVTNACARRFCIIIIIVIIIMETSKIYLYVYMCVCVCERVCVRLYLFTSLQYTQKRKSIDAQEERNKVWQTERMGRNGENETQRPRENYRMQWKCMGSRD